jgi:hypothetical protein
MTLRELSVVCVSIDEFHSVQHNPTPQATTHQQTPNTRTKHPAKTLLPTPHQLTSHDPDLRGFALNAAVHIHHNDSDAGGVEDSDGRKWDRRT